MFSWPNFVNCFFFFRTVLGEAWSGRACTYLGREYHDLHVRKLVGGHLPASGYECLGNLAHVNHRNILTVGWLLPESSSQLRVQISQRACVLSVMWRAWILFP